MKGYFYIILIPLLGTCKKASIIPDKTPYKVTYRVYSPSIYGAIYYHTIPANGELGDLYEDRFFKGTTKIINLDAQGYHNARYYLSAECASWGEEGWMYISVYQDEKLVKLDSAFGTVTTKITVNGTLPK